MIKYAKIVADVTKICNVALGTDVEYYKSLGFKELDVEQGFDGNYYICGFAPTPPVAPPQTLFTKLEIRRAFRASGKESFLDEILGSNTTFAKDWADADHIDLADPITKEAISSAGFSEEQLQMLIEEIGS